MDVEAEAIQSKSNTCSQGKDQECQDHRESLKRQLCDEVDQTETSADVKLQPCPPKRLTLEPSIAGCSNDEATPGQTSSTSDYESKSIHTDLAPTNDDGGKEACSSTSTLNSSTATASKGNMLDPLSYTKNEEFTSEIYKIQIHNAPKFGFHQLKKRLVSLGLKPHKLKSPRNGMIYVCFRNEEDRQVALKKLHGHVWKGKTLDARMAAPVADPFLQKKKTRNSTGDTDSATSTETSVTSCKEPMSEEEAIEKLKASVAPWADVNYTEQLDKKEETIREVLKKLMRNHVVRDTYRDKLRKQADCLPCQLESIIPSPITEKYRNKNEFTVGYGMNGDVKVGFRYGLYKDGTTMVGDCSTINFIMPAALPVVESFQKFVCTSKWPPYAQETNSGHWQTLTVRTFQTGDVMAMVDFVPRRLEQAEVESAKASIKEFYTEGDGRGITIKSFYFRIMGSSHMQKKLEHCFGDTNVHESVLGLKFRISPEAFFQVNTPATEKLYTAVKEWGQVTKNTTVFDICCGTGTIGLTMAKDCKDVIGIEMCSPAVLDAKMNAEVNGITNATFYCSKVEDVIGRLTASVMSSSSPPSSPSTSEAPAPSHDFVAIVDPPRAGLHKNVIKTLRKCKPLKRLVYVSCNPERAIDNFLDLIRPETGKLRGAPFSLVKAQPVDLFPGTRHCELILLFTRDKAQPTTTNTSKDCNTTIDVKWPVDQDCKDKTISMDQGNKDKSISMDQDNKAKLSQWIRTT